MLDAASGRAVQDVLDLVNLSTNLSFEDASMICDCKIVTVSMSSFVGMTAVSWIRRADAYFRLS